MNGPSGLLTLYGFLLIHLCCGALAKVPKGPGRFYVRFRSRNNKLDLRTALPFSPDRQLAYLTQRGWMELSSLYESPFTDLSSRGVEGVFSPKEVDGLLTILSTIRQHADI